MEKQQSVNRQQTPPPPSALSPQEWETVVEDFSSGEPSARGRWVHLPLIDLALAALLRRDFPPSLKPLLLLFLEDYSHPLLSPSPIPPLLEALRSFLLLPSSSTSLSPVAGDPTAALRDQFMATVTSVAISSVDSPPDPSSVLHLESLVEVLLAVVNRPNHSPDRQSRAAACECLRELESAFPCLLSDVVGHLRALAQAERTHAAQSYLLLVATVVRNIVLHGLLSSSSSVLTSSSPLVPFNAPTCCLSSTNRNDEQQHQEPPSDLNLREIKRVMAFLWERPQVLTPAATAQLVSVLTDVASALEQYVPAIGALLKVQFFGLVYSYDPILCHVVLMLYSRFPDAFSGEDERSMARRLALISRETNQPLVFCLLALHWLLGSPGLRDGNDTLPLLMSSFYPAVFDPLALKAKKLDALAYTAARIDNSEGGKEDEGKGQKAQKLKLLEDGLVCVSAYKWLPPWSTETSVAFRTLHKFWVGVAPHSSIDNSETVGTDILINSTIFQALQGMLVELALDYRVLVPVIAIFIDRLIGCKTHHSAGERLLQNLDEHLLPKLQLDYQLASYFPIFERIAENDTIPPRGLLDLLTRQIFWLKEKHNPDTWLKSWSQGTKVLGICRMMLKHHHSSRVFLPLARLLSVICQWFPDLEVRDNARIYLRMLVSIPGKKLRQILSLGEHPLGVSPSPHPGSLFQVPSPRVSENFKRSGGVSSYIFLERLIPLLVKQSWALALPKSSIGNNGEPNYIIDISSINAVDSAELRTESAEFERINIPKEPLRMMDSNVAEILRILRRHFSCIPDFRHMPGIKIKIPCMLRFDSEKFNHAWGDGSSTFDSEDFDGLPAMHAIVITFSSTSKFGIIPPCRVPFLVGQPSEDKYAIVPVAGNNYEEDSTFIASVVIELEPREPMPGLINATIKANTENGQIISGKLQSVAVGIEDMFLGSNIPPDVKEGEKCRYCFDLFHALWEACGNSTNTGRETFSLSGGKGITAINGTRSVKLLEVSHDCLINNVEKYLSSFVVGVIGDSLVNVVRNNGVIREVIWEDSSDDFTGDDARALVPYSEQTPLQLPYFEDDGDKDNRSVINERNMGTFLLLIFLPPRFHLLLQMEVSSLSTLVRMRTDHWPCLAYVDEYLESLFYT